MAIGSRKKIFLGPYYAKGGLKGRLMVIRIRHSLLCSFGNYYSFIIPMTNTIYILLYSIGGLLITLSKYAVYYKNQLHCVCVGMSYLSNIWRRCRDFKPTRNKVVPIYIYVNICTTARNAWLKMTEFSFHREIIYI